MGIEYIVVCEKHKEIIELGKASDLWANINTLRHDATYSDKYELNDDLKTIVKQYILNDEYHIKTKEWINKHFNCELYFRQDNDDSLLEKPYLWIDFWGEEHIWG